MSNSALVRKTYSKDQLTNPIYLDIVSGVNSDGSSNSRFITDTRYGARVVLIAGVQPSYGQTHVPFRRFGPTKYDEQAPAVALLKNGLGKVKMRRRGCMYYYESGKRVNLLCGTVVEMPHMIGKDGGEIITFDDKWRLTKVTSFGRLCYDPEGSEGVSYFDAGAPCIFNMNGWGDCVDSPVGPRFAPSHRFGWDADASREDTKEPPVGGDAHVSLTAAVGAAGSSSPTIKPKARARKWRVADCLAYLRDVHYLGIGVSRADYGKRTINSNWIIWPENLISDASANRYVNNLVCENISLFMALDKIVKKAGANEIYFQAGKEFKSTLKIVSMNPSDQVGVELMLPTYNNATLDDLMTDALAVKGGYVKESIVNYFDDVCICGDPVAIEREVSMNPTGLEIRLEAAWSAETFAAFKAYVTANGNTKAAFIAATKIYPDVFCSYRIKAGEKIWDATKWGDYSTNEMPHARFRAFLLSAYNIKGATENPRDRIARDVVVEFYNPSTTDWEPAERYDFFSLSLDGQRVSFSNLRDKDNPQTWYSSSGGYNGADLLPINIRMTIVLESDWRITGIAGIGEAGDPNQTSDRIASDERDRFTYLSVAEPLDYVEELALDRHPNGKSGVGGIDASVDNFPSKSIDGNELYTDRSTVIDDNGNEKVSGRISDHAKARLMDVKRIEYTGQIPLSRFNPAMHPGQAVSIAGADGTLSCPSVVRTVVHDAGLQGTLLELGGREAGGIFDIPSRLGNSTPLQIESTPARNQASNIQRDAGYLENEPEESRKNRYQ